MHLAHIKVNRLDTTYHSTFSNSKFKYYEKESKNLMENILKGNGSIKYYRRSELAKLLNDWENLIETKGVESTLHKTGTYTIESRELQLDILNVGVEIYVNTINKYCKISKVEVNLDNSVNYYVNYDAIHDDKFTNMRYDTVEEWFKCMYPNLDNFNDLISHRYEEHPVYQTYTKFKDFGYKVIYGDADISDYNNEFGIKEEEPLLEKNEEVIVDSDSEYVEVKENHHVPVEVYKSTPIVKEDSGRATFAVAMLSMLFIGLVMLTLVVTNL